MGQLLKSQVVSRGRCWAMTRMEQPLAIPREMSSRSANVSARPERRRTGVAIPRVAPKGNG